MNPMLFQFPFRPTTREIHVKFRRHADGRFFVIASMFDTDEGDVVAARAFCSVICTPDWRLSSRAPVAAANDGPVIKAPVLPPLLILPPPYTPGPRLVS